MNANPKAALAKYTDVPKRGIAFALFAVSLYQQHDEKSEVLFIIDHHHHICLENLGPHLPIHLFAG